MDQPPGFRSQTKAVYFAYIWHGFFLAVTMSMLDLNTVFPALISELTASKILFGLLYAIMLGAPLVFNLVFSHYLKTYRYKKKFLLLGIYMRSAAFLGMSLTTWLLGRSNTGLVIFLFFVWVFIFSISAGFAGIAYGDLMGKVLPSRQRTQLYAAKQFVGSLAAFAGGLLIAGLFKPGRLAFPDNYAISLGIGCIGLALAALGFYRIHEPPSEPSDGDQKSLLAYIRAVPGVLKEDIRLRRFIVVENLTSFSVMILPFYMIFARETFQLDSSYIGTYLLMQVTGTVLSSLLWGFLARKTTSRAIVRICIYLGASIPVLAIFLSLTTPHLFGIVFFLLGFIVSGRRVGFEPYLLDIAPDPRRTEYLGIRGTLNIFIVILPILGGLFISLMGYVITFSIVSAVMLLSGWLARKREEDGPSPEFV